MLRRLVVLTQVVPSLSYFNVWDLPLSVCREYLRLADAVKARIEKG